MAVTILMLIVSTTCMTGASTMLLSLLPLRFHAMGRMATVTGLLNASAYVGSALASTGFGALSENGGWTAVLTGSPCGCPTTRAEWWTCSTGRQRWSGWSTVRP